MVPRRDWGEEHNIVKYVDFGAFAKLIRSMSVKKYVLLAHNATKVLDCSNKCILQAQIQRQIAIYTSSSRSDQDSFVQCHYCGTEFVERKYSKF